MAEISQEELDALRAAAAERDQMKAEAQAQAADARPVKAPPAPQFRAVCADGSAYDYAGAHPTHIDHGAGPVAVVAVHPLPREDNPA